MLVVLINGSMLGPNGSDTHKAKTFAADPTWPLAPPIAKNITARLWLGLAALGGDVFCGTNRDDRAFFIGSIYICA